MKKLSIIGLGLLLIGLAITPAYADLNGSASSSVYVDVNPNIGVLPGAAAVSAGTVQTGKFNAQLTFRIDANMEQINMFVEASDLYKGDYTASPIVPPILLDRATTAKIAAQFGNRVNALPNEAAWGAAGGGANIGTYPTAKTEEVKYESAQSGHFSQNVVITIGYIQPDPEKPMGNYSGKVRLTAFLVP
jgi:hypothetical protein